MSKTIADVVREYFPGITDGCVEFIAWEHTGYPSFWSIPEDGNTPEECFRKQLQEYKDSIKENDAKRMPFRD